MSFFDQVYDEMSWQEVCYRLPSELAVNALKRRVNNLETLQMFFDNVGDQPISVKELKSHVNNILNLENPADILDKFGTNYEKVIFNWMDDTNRQRLKNHDQSKLSTKFLFNVADSGSREDLHALMGRVLSEATINQSHIRSILSKADNTHINSLVDVILKDARPEVRACVLSVGSLTNKSMISDMQMIIGLKALAQCNYGNRPSSISVLSIEAFANLRPLERLNALEIYLGYFPEYKKIQAFDPAPTDDEFNMILFAGCIEHNERVTKLNEKYNRITKEDPPDNGEDEEED